MAGRFEYNSIHFSFDRSWNNVQVYPQQVKSENISDAGIKHTINHYSQDIIEVTRERLTGSEIEQLEEWYEYVKDGSSFELWLDHDTGMYLPFEGKSTTSTDGESATFARTGTANVLDPTSGNYESIAAATARFPAGKFGRGLLIERASTNSIINNNDINGAWTTSNMTVSSDQMLAPDGTVGADKLTSTAVFGYVYQDLAGTVGTDDGCLSVWARSLSGDVSFVLQIGDDSPDNLAGDTFIATPTWQRFQIAYENTGSNANAWQPRISVVSNGYSIYVWQPQFEKTKLYASSYIETAGAAVTRNAETIYYTLDNDNFNNEEFSISFWFKPEWDSDEITTSYNSLLWISESAGSNRLFSLLATPTNLEFLLKDYEQNTITAATASYTFSKNTWYYIVLTCDASSSNSASIYVNGSLSNTPNHDAFVPSAFGRLYLGSVFGQYADSVIDDVLIEKRAISASEVASRYNRERAMGIRQNHYDSVRLVNPEFRQVRKVGMNRWDFSATFEEVLT